jgi:transcriptional regulator with XRE-family HTH domain
MKLSSALSQKIVKICKERNISVNRLASISYLTQSTVQSLIAEKSKNPKLLTIVRICEGLNIPLKDFFDDEIFDNIEREEE